MSKSGVLDDVPLVLMPLVVAMMIGTWWEVGVTRKSQPEHHVGQRGVISLINGRTTGADAIVDCRHPSIKRAIVAVTFQLRSEN